VNQQAVLHGVSYEKKATGPPRNKLSVSTWTSSYLENVETKQNYAVN